MAYKNSGVLELSKSYEPRGTSPGCGSRVQETDVYNNSAADIGLTELAEGAIRDSDVASGIEVSVAMTGFYIDATALDRIEKREKEGRVKAARRLRSRVNRHSPSK